ncbi:glycosyl hydrolase family 8 [Shigella flexneri]
MLLPGRVGFAEETHWRFNPSHFPPQVAEHFSSSLARRGQRYVTPT